MSKKQGLNWITKAFLCRLHELHPDATDDVFEYAVTKQHVKFSNPITEAMWLGYVEGHVMTKKNQFGHLIIAKHGPNGRPKFSEVPYTHKSHTSAREELKRLVDLMPEETFGLYRCIELIKPKNKDAGTKEVGQDYVEPLQFIDTM